MEKKQANHRQGKESIGRIIKMVFCIILTAAGIRGALLSPAVQSIFLTEYTKTVHQLIAVQAVCWALLCISAAAVLWTKKRGRLWSLLCMLALGISLVVINTSIEKRKQDELRIEYAEENISVYCYTMDEEGWVPVAVYARKGGEKYQIALEDAMVNGQAAGVVYPGWRGKAVTRFYVEDDQGNAIAKDDIDTFLIRLVIYDENGQRVFSSPMTQIYPL